MPLRVLSHRKQITTMPTKEEILESKEIISYYINDQYEDIINIINDSMEEYAKQESLEFAKFVRLLNKLLHTDYRSNEKLWNEYQLFKASKK